jgi:hypothetical protein
LKGNAWLAVDQDGEFVIHVGLVEKGPFVCGKQFLKNVSGSNVASFLFYHRG